jgi:molecular chaperone GrpE
MQQEHGAAAPPEGTPPDPEDRARAAEERAERLLANWQRAQADLANYRRQVEREREELAALATATLVADLLPALDDVERALAALPEPLRRYTWVEGVWLIGKKLEGALAAHGMEEVEAQGQPMDPRCHQAVGEVDGAPGVVVDVVQKGYRLGGRLVRPALVTVGRGQAEAEESASEGGEPSEQSL